MRAAMFARVCQMGALCAALLWSGQARAQEQALSLSPEGGEDFALEGDGWRGLSNLFKLARAEGIELYPSAKLDYSDLSLDEPLLVIAPAQELRADSLTRYVADGGRVFVADELGSSGALLSRLELVRVAPQLGGLPHNEFLRGNPALPILRPRGVHPMLEGVSVVVANHPAVLSNIGGPVVGYSDDGGLIYDMNLGRGKVIVAADSSLLINHMLFVGDNAQLIRNTLRYLCQHREGCRIRLYVGAFAQRGAWDELGGLREDLAQDVSRWNESVRRAMEQLPAERLFYSMSLLLTVGVVIYLFTIFPVRKPRPHSDALRLAQRPHTIPQSEFDWSLARYLEGSAGMNYAQPVAILKEVFEELFLTELGLWAGDEAQRKPVSDVRLLAERFAERYMREASPAQVKQRTQELVELWTTLAKVPGRHRVFLDNDVYFSERDLLKIHERCMWILDQMNRREDYERRTRNHI